MSDKAIQKQIEAIRRATKEACASEAAARAFLVRAGILTKSGKPAPAYR